MSIASIEIGSILVAAISASALMVQAIVSRKKDKETHQISSDDHDLDVLITTQKVIQESVTHLRQENEELRRQVEALRAWSQEVCVVLRDNNLLYGVPPVPL